MATLTPHFSLDELTVSNEGARRGLDNTPGPDVIRNLTRLANVMEEVRALLGVPIHINSGYRSPAVNAAIGGAKHSAHLEGLAADFTAGTFGSPLDIARKIAASDIIYDQLIFEHTWVHLGLAEDGHERRQELTLATGGGYLSGIVAKDHARRAGRAVPVVVLTPHELLLIIRKCCRSCV